MAYRVLIAQFMHETNTFSKLPTTLDDYRKRWLIEGEAMVPRFTGTKNEIGGYIDRQRRTAGSRCGRGRPTPRHRASSPGKPGRRCAT
jgi:hypothetical protein